MNNPVKEELDLNLGVIGVALLIIGAFIYFIAQSINRPIKRLSADFDVMIQNVKQAEDLEDIVRKTAILSDMITEMNTLIGEVKSISNKTQEVSITGIEILEKLDATTTKPTYWH